jgi:hypothetical protein
VPLIQNEGGGEEQIEDGGKDAQTKEAIFDLKT